MVAGAELCGLVLAPVAFSLAALLRVRSLLAAVRRQAREASRAQDSAIEALGALVKMSCRSELRKVTRFRTVRRPLWREAAST